MTPLEWKLAVTAAGCLLHPDGEGCRGPLQGAHVVSKSKLRRLGRTDLFYDKRNGVGLCGFFHNRHDKGLERIPWTLLPAAALEFADELGLRWWIERFWPVTEREAA